MPYISELVYYPDCTDVFPIGDPGGISYYLVDKIKHDNKTITNISFKQKLYNDRETRSFNELCLLNKGWDIAEKVMKGQKPISIEKLNKSKLYQVWSANKVSLVSNIPKTYLWATNGMFNCFGLCQLGIRGKTRLEQNIPNDSVLIFSSDNKEECNSFISWVYTRFTRYLISLSLCGLTGIGANDTWWRFVPDPGSFNMIYTDKPQDVPGIDMETGEYIGLDGIKRCSLYIKYKLIYKDSSGNWQFATDSSGHSYVSIIESVIKERK